MELIFSVTAQTPSSPPILGDTDFLAHYTGANRNMMWEELTPGIRQAVEKYIIPYIGRSMYNELADYYVDPPNTPIPAMDQAVTLLQDCVAYYTAYHVLPERNAFLTSMGVTQNTPADGSGQPINQWGYKAKRWNALENGDMFLDTLMRWMEDNNGDGDFDTWTTAPEYTSKVSNFFKHTDDLDSFLNMQRSRRSFISLVKYCRQVEEDVVKALLCDDLYSAVLDDTPTAANALLIPMIRRAVANLGLAAAVPHHRIVIDGDGFRVVSQTDQFDDRRNQTNNVHEGAINALAQRAEMEGRKAMAKLEAFLYTNKDDYPLWTASDCYTETPSKGHTIRYSEDKRGGVGIF
jgi:hypothetical protein